MNFGQNNAPLMDGMIVDLFGIRFEEVLNAPVIGNAHDSIILADEAYAITKLQGEGNVRVITKGLGSAGVDDPLDQRQSIGYKITGFSAKVLRPESVVNYWSKPGLAIADYDTSKYDVPAATKIGGADPAVAGQTGEAFTFTVALNAYNGAATSHPSGTEQVLAGIKGLTFAQALKLLGYNDDAVFYSVVGSAIDPVADNLLDKGTFITEDVTVYYFGEAA